ncbi:MULTISPECIES: hypothetical protein [Streptomyces]|uniref:hypothetical protein n=1 Tax=Streptomyces TaxID=1883 RepID=UPI001CCFB86E|nr:MULTISPECIES: hypothetical protein [Streptomyces]MBZ6138241.1 hypothetical protein [Streptomyces olivaceus]MBZ6167960.1 hypothetical protein [Streptomyces olivaceus]MCM8550666.1 hypothetical protein [Streptomyces sp. STCH 565 A]
MADGRRHPDRLVLQGILSVLHTHEAEALLTMVTVRPFFSGCPQIGHEGALLKNYDLAP